MSRHYDGEQDSEMYILKNPSKIWTKSDNLERQ
jgi:hypothetical protein